MTPSSPWSARRTRRWSEFDRAVASDEAPAERRRRVARAAALNGAPSVGSSSAPSRRSSTSPCFLLLPIVWAWRCRSSTTAPGATGARRSAASVATTRSSGSPTSARCSTSPTLRRRKCGDFRNGLKVTALFTVLVVPLNLLITLPLAALIESVHRRWPGVPHDLLPARAHVGGGRGDHVAVHPRSAAWIAQWSTLEDHRRAGRRGLDLGPQPRLPGLARLVAVVVAYLWQDIGYNLVIFIAALQAIPVA